MNGLMQGKKIIIMGVASERSLGWGVARSLHTAGAEMIFTYRQDRSAQKLEKLLAAEGMDSMMVQCDVADDESIHRAFAEISQCTDTVHGLVHSIAFADKDELKGEYIETSREGYLLAQNASSYSLVAAARAVRPLMKSGGSIVTQSYLGAERVVKNYNVMGVAKAALEASVRYLAEDLGKEQIRVNAVSSGPVRTLSAKGVAGFNDILGTMAEKAPLRRNVDQAEIGDATLFFLSDLSRGVTGEVLHVDGGYHILG
ncbi:enoyl-ACP reductase FabI [Paenibacillus senegalensis]|uniref:enoyl-ACP reductase FabI n=1 Tax=Paenibacillus senegalensis TaxID=1465766 RepID=UPI0002882135|nr:enoyl-ACP reductase FabI [Paenibacillus senegalensis]